jgi:hypothetical protein
MGLWPRTVQEWGSSAGERALPFPCDALVSAPDAVLFRALDVDADAGIVFRWLCQLSLAPYSYDRLDNRGRRSPQTLTPGADELEVGQRVMGIFTITSFEPGRSITMLSTGRLFGRVGVTYLAEPRSSSRLLVKMCVAYSASGLRGLPMRVLFPPGDLVMMRRQLLNFKALAERTQRTRPAGAG